MNASSEFRERCTKTPIGEFLPGDLSLQWVDRHTYELFVVISNTKLGYKGPGRVDTIFLTGSGRLQFVTAYYYDIFLRIEL